MTGGRLAAEHLLSLGHRRVAQLIGPQDIWSFEGRARGFRDAIVAAGASCQDVRTTLRLPTAQAGREVVSDFLAGHDDLPTAIFAHNESIAIGALGVLRDHGFECPDDISVIGYNDVPLTVHLNPPLTTIRLPGYELGVHHASRTRRTFRRGGHDARRRPCAAMLAGVGGVLLTDESGATLVTHR